MDEKDLEQTKVLDELSDLINYDEEPEFEDIDRDIDTKESENILKSLESDLLNQFDKEEENLEDNSTEKPEGDNKTKKEKKKDKKSLLQRFKELDKKKKIIILSLLAVFIILVIVLLVITLNKKKDDIVETKPPVVIIKDNYRYEDGKLIILDDKQNEIGTYECENKHEDLCYVAYNSNEDEFDNTLIVDENNNQYEAPSKVFNSRYIFVSDNKEGNTKLISLYDLEENKTIEVYQLFKTFDNYVIAKNKTGNYGVLKLESSVNTIIDFNHDYIGVANEENEELTKLVTKKSGKWYLTDITGTNLTKGTTYQIKGFSASNIKVINSSNMYLVLNYDGNQINNEAYDYVELLQDYFVYVNGKKAYIKDYNNNRMNITGVELNHLQYRNKVTYNTETTAFTTEKSFNAAVDNNLFKLTVQKEDSYINHEINLLEGKLNQKIKNMEYFNGILYFYKDTEKTNLIGSYTCENKNEMIASTTEYNNCKIAIDSTYENNELEVDQSANVGFISIYNDRFVFIEDTPTIKTEENKNIVLYDLSANKTLGKYKTVNTYSYTKLKEVSFSNSAETYVVAENKKGQFGMIKMTKTTVTGVLAFNYDRVEKAGNNYIVQETSENVTKFSLYNALGNKITGDYNEKIIDYNSNYVKILKDNLYYIYDYQGNQLINNGFTYISLYNSFYAAVSGNVLNLYKYAAPSNPLIEDGIILERNNFTSGDIRPYRISQLNSYTIRIEKGLNNNTYENFSNSYSIA